MNALKKIEEQLNKELYNEFNKLYTVTAYVLWTKYGWRKKRIITLFGSTQEIWEECANYGQYKSMLQMLEEETGIEMAVPGKPSYHTIAYLNGDIKYDQGITLEKMIYIRQRQKDWLTAIVLSGIALALYREYGFGFKRTNDFLQYVFEITGQYGKDCKKYYFLLDSTGFEVADIIALQQRKRVKDEQISENDTAV